MIELFLYIGGALLIGAVIYMIIASRVAYREAKARQIKIDWTSHQLERALDQTRSPAGNEVLAGIQCLSTLNLPEIRYQALHRLDELTEDEDPEVAKLAESALIRLSKSTAQAECPNIADSEQEKTV
jgi:hypothetical protein